MHICTLPFQPALDMTPLHSQTKSAAPHILGTVSFRLETLKSLSNEILVPCADLVVGAGAQVIETVAVSCVSPCYYEISAQVAGIGGPFGRQKSQSIDQSRLYFDAGHRAAFEGENCSRGASGSHGEHGTSRRV
jgi:hypothetical protein